MDVERIAVTIRDAIRDIPKRYSDNAERIRQIEDEIMDWQHYLEFVKFNAYEGYEVARRIKEIRQERRMLKDENEELKHIVGELTNMKNRKNAFDKAIGNIRKAKTSRINRGYNCRARKDLQERINA